MNKKTNKTAHVLKLLTNAGDGIENPIMNEDFKEEVIHVRSKPQSVAAEDTATEPSLPPTPVVDAATINVISELVYELLPSILERFRCCTCDICKAEIAIEALNQMSPKYVRITNENSFSEVEVLKEKYRKEVTSNLVKNVIAHKRDSAHNRIN